MNFNDINEELFEIERKIAECPLVCADKLGLDWRAGHVYVGEDFVASSSAGSLNYYGGFEYVDEECITQVGRIVVYSNEDERVAECLETYNAALHNSEL
jgi:hypothetical protein